MDVHNASLVKSVYKGRTYVFCEPGHKTRFDADPEGFLKKAE
jgi:YHS domain-containing protein